MQPHVEVGPPDLPSGAEPHSSVLLPLTEISDARLVLLRHGESIWNRENRFTGWTDVDLSEKCGRGEAGGGPAQGA